MLVFRLLFTEPDHSRMLSNYLPVLLFLITGIVIGAAALAAGRVLSPRNPYPAKLSAYECGFEAFEDARMKFDVRYYLVAILFIIFDLEIAFLFPWAIVLDEIGVFGFLAMMLFPVSYTHLTLPTIYSV